MKHLRYVIQEHHATHLHFDLRLEYDGAAKSWAIPKRPEFTHGIKRLAVQVDDHDVDYMQFEGTIPEGEYGAGKVKIWDKGYWVPEHVDEKKIVGELHGKRFTGRFTLLQFKGKNWLFFKAKET